MSFILINLCFNDNLIRPYIYIIKPIFKFDFYFCLSGMYLDLIVCEEIITLKIWKRLIDLHNGI